MSRTDCLGGGLPRLLTSGETDNGEDGNHLDELSRLTRRATNDTVQRSGTTRQGVWVQGVGLPLSRLRPRRPGSRRGTMLRKETQNPRTTKLFWHPRLVSVPVNVVGPDVETCDPRESDFVVEGYSLFLPHSPSCLFRGLRCPDCFGSRNPRETKKF